MLDPRQALTVTTRIYQDDITCSCSKFLFATIASCVGEVTIYQGWPEKRSGHLVPCLGCLNEILRDQQMCEKMGKGALFVCVFS